jgi:molybdopterin-guanine dinucleotide biosynthesis protein A
VARYTPELAPALEASMMRGEPLQRAVRSLEPQVLDWEELAKLGDPDRLLFNVNTPSDVEQAERLLAKA